MNVLLIGGSGHVGTMTLPYMKSHHNFRVLDLNPPKDTAVDYIQGSVTDPDIVQEALKGMDTFVYMVMLQPTSDRSSVAGFQRHCRELRSKRKRTTYRSTCSEGSWYPTRCLYKYLHRA